MSRPLFDPLRICSVLLTIACAGMPLAVLGQSSGSEPEESTSERTGESEDSNQPNHGADAHAEKASPNPGDLDEATASKETSIPGGYLVLAAYGIFWLMLFGFAYQVYRRQRGLDEKFNQLQEKLDSVYDEALDLADKEEG